VADGAGEAGDFAGSGSHKFIFLPRIARMTRMGKGRNKGRK
jgi:hypothetical protein